MHRTIEVIVHADGTFQPLEALEIRGKRRALLTILEEIPQSTTPATLTDLEPTIILKHLHQKGLIIFSEEGSTEKIPLSRAERELLAKSIPIGTPLSQIIVDDREDRC